MVCFVVEDNFTNSAPAFYQSTIANVANLCRKVTASPVALHRLGTRNIAQSQRAYAFRCTIMHMRSNFTNIAVEVIRISFSDYFSLGRHKTKDSDIGVKIEINLSH